MAGPKLPADVLLVDEELAEAPLVALRRRGPAATDAAAKFTFSSDVEEPAALEELELELELELEPPLKAAV